MLTYLTVFIGLFIAERFYFRLADHFDIIDKPNERSSHERPTIRGGGIVFYLAVVAFFILSGFKYPWFFIGTSLVSIISFFDDIYDLSSKLRLAIQLLSVALISIDAAAFAQPWWWIPFMIIVVTGIVNVFNFMDGINGITGFYGLVTLGTLVYLNVSIGFADNRLIVMVILSLLVLGYFNFRKNAACFPGDIGSVSLACVSVFLLLKLILATQNYYFILLLAVYGVDSSLTIFRRLRRGENILKPHRSHLYQQLVKPGPFSHLQVASAFASAQIVINIVIVSIWHNNNPATIMSALILGFLIGLYFLTYRTVKKANKGTL